MPDAHRPTTLTLRSRTIAAKPTHWPTLNPCHFTVPCFIFKTKTFSFFLKQALSNKVFGVKIGRTTTLRRLFEVINFRRSKFVSTLSPCPVFSMCAAGLATHLTTPVCPVARTQTIILQVVYSSAERTSLLQVLSTLRLVKTQTGVHVVVASHVVLKMQFLNPLTWDQATGAEYAPCPTSWTPLQGLEALGHSQGHAARFRYSEFHCSRPIIGCMKCLHFTLHLNSRANVGDQSTSSQAEVGLNGYMTGTVVCLELSESY